MALHDTVPSFYDPAIPIDFKIKKLFFFAKTRRIQIVPHIHFSTDNISVVKVFCHLYQLSPL